MGKFIDFDVIRETYPILEVVTRLLNVELKADGENKYRGACPFCEDKRSFRVTTNAGSHGHGMAGCFKCGPKGDSIAVVSKKFNLKANDAAALIVEKLGAVSIPEPVSIPPAGTSIPKSDNKLEKVVARLEYEHEEVQALGLSPETAENLTIGYLRTGIMAGRVCFGLYQDGQLVGFMGFAPDLQPVIKFPKDFIEAPMLNVVKFPKAG